MKKKTIPSDSHLRQLATLAFQWLFEPEAGTYYDAGICSRRCFSTQLLDFQMDVTRALRAVLSDTEWFALVLVHRDGLMSDEAVRVAMRFHALPANCRADDAIASLERKAGLILEDSGFADIRAAMRACI